MELRNRMQGIQENRSDPRNKWTEKSDFCDLFKVLVLALGIMAICVLVLVNAWLSLETPVASYKTRRIYIEDSVLHSEMINYAADFNSAKVIDSQPQNTKGFIDSLVNPSVNNPEKALSMNNQIGNCWGFEGTRGSITIKIQKPIFPMHFSIKHVNIANFDSAPKHFCVYRASENEELLGCYDFSISKGKVNPEFTQIFECVDNCNKETSAFKFMFMSNHGAKHTCIYQILIHGDPTSLSY